MQQLKKHLKFHFFFNSSSFWHRGVCLSPYKSASLRWKKKPQHSGASGTIHRKSKMKTRPLSRVDCWHQGFCLVGNIPTLCAWQASLSIFGWDMRTLDRPVILLASLPPPSAVLCTPHRFAMRSRSNLRSARLCEHRLAFAWLCSLRLKPVVQTAPHDARTTKERQPQGLSLFCWWSIFNES